MWSHDLNPSNVQREKIMKFCCLACALTLLISTPVGGEEVALTPQTLPLKASGTESQDNQSGLFSQPTLGFVFDQNKSGLRPIWGIAGASSLGDVVPLQMKVARAWISPRQNYALAESSDQTQLLIINLESGPLGVSAIAGSRSGADKIAISPSGTAALLYFEKQRRVQLLVGLPQSATFGAEVDLSALPHVLTSLAVSDDGGAIILGIAEESSGAVYLAKPGGELRKISLVGEATALSFLTHGLDVLLADRVNNSVWVLKDVLGTAVGVQLAGENDGISEPIAVASSRDSQRIFVANAGSQSLATLDLATGRWGFARAGRSVTGLYSLKGESVFRLTDLSDQPLLVLDGGNAEARVVFVPMPPGSNRSSYSARSQTQPLRTRFPRK
jgi:hypothetical protein